MNGIFNKQSVVALYKTYFVGGQVLMRGHHSNGRNLLHNNVQYFVSRHLFIRKTPCHGHNGKGLPLYSINPLNHYTAATALDPAADIAPAIIDRPPFRINTKSGINISGS